MKAKEQAEWLFDDIEVYAWDWAEIDVVKAKIADVIREAEQKEPVSWQQIYDVLYSMRLAPRHQLEQASKEVAKLFAAPPADAASIRQAALQEVAEGIADALHDSAIAGATGTGIYVSSGAASAFGDIAVAYIESLMENDSAPPAPAIPDDVMRELKWAVEDANCDTRTMALLLRIHELFETAPEPKEGT